MEFRQSKGTATTLLVLAVTDLCCFRSNFGILVRRSTLGSFLSSHRQVRRPKTTHTPGEEECTGEGREARHRAPAGEGEDRDSPHKDREQYVRPIVRCLGLYREHTAVINEDIYVELLELLELYCELLIARFGLLDQK